MIASSASLQAALAKNCHAFTDILNHNEPLVVFIEVNDLQKSAQD